MNTMNWYVAEGVFKSSIPEAGTDYVPLVERSWFLVSAENESAAQAKARVLGQGKEHSYSNASGERVCWVFESIENTREIMDDVLADGTELWSCISRAEDASAK